MSKLDLNMSKGKVERISHNMNNPYDLFVKVSNSYLYIPKSM